MFAFCALFGHRLVIPTGTHAFDPIRCSRCSWTGPKTVPLNQALRDLWQPNDLGAA